MSDVITLARPEELSTLPKIGLHLLVKNGASVVGRLIGGLAPYLTEVVAVLNDCDDDTMTEIASCCLDRGLVARFVVHDRRTNPENYLPDVAETYQVGRPLAGESYAGPFTGIPILADWAAARNAGWGAGTADFRLMLDADDEVEDPHCLPGLCRLMDEKGLDVLASRYHYGHTMTGVPRADAFRERLVRNLPEIGWWGKVHECLMGYDPTRVAHVDGNLVVHDRRDSTGREIRIPGRNLKVLYYRARLKDWDLTPREMVYLAAEAKSVMPDLAAMLVRMHLEVSRWDEEKAWAATIMGEICESREEYAIAAGWYERSLKFHPGVMAAMRLARAYFHMGLWVETIRAYAQGVENKAHPQFLDGGQVFEDATKIFVAASLRKLGKLREAAAMSEMIRRQFPASPALAKMAEFHATAAERGDLEEVPTVTLSVLAKMICLASGVFGRPAWDDARCTEHAAYVMESAGRHEISPVLMVAVNIVECDMRDIDNPIYLKIRGRDRLVGYDACPMGVRIMGAENRRRYGARDLYELAAARMEHWKSWCARRHRGDGHHFIAHYNDGNPAYAYQVLGVFAALRVRPVRTETLTDRTLEIVRRLVRVFVRGWS